MGIFSGKNVEYKPDASKKCFVLSKVRAIDGDEFVVSSEHKRKQVVGIEAGAFEKDLKNKENHY